MNKLIRVGTIVQLWCDASNYGVITKINKVTFVVEHNLHGKTYFLIDSLDPHMNVNCKNQIFKGTLIPPENMNSKLFNFLYKNAIYRGLWWIKVENQLKKLYLEFN